MSLSNWQIKDKHLLHIPCPKEPDLPSKVYKKRVRWVCSECKKVAPKKIVFAAELCFCIEKAPLEGSFSALGDALLRRYVVDFIGQLQTLDTPIYSTLKEE